MFNKELLKKYVAEYKENFQEIRFGKDREIYKWEAVEHFQRNWDVDALDFPEMLKESLAKTENLLTVGMFFARGMLLGLTNKEPETVREMFRNLFDESKDLSQRVSEFTNSADGLHKRNPGGKKHFQGTRAISVYLWLKYPEKYYAYHYAIYTDVVKLLEADYVIKANGKPESMLEGFKFYDEIRAELAKDIELVKLNLENGVDGYIDESLNTLTADVGFYISKQNEIWEPTLKEYDPKISVVKWKELLANEDVFTEKALKVVNGILTLGGQATCKQLAESFGETYNFYNSVSVALAKRVQAITNCPMPPKKDVDSERYWPILYVGRNTKGEEGVFEWRLRDELKEALVELGLPKEYFKKVEEIKNMPKYPKNLILYGPPGTGKTYNSVNYAVAIIENKTIDEICQENREAVLVRFKNYKDNGLIEFCTFHQSYGYEEFIEGIKPKIENGNVLYKVQDGVFKGFCKEEQSKESRNKVFIIDEINRGNISKIFGELITLIEDNKRIGACEAMQVRLPYSGEKFGVPQNVYLLGTMNTADRSIALIDTALRRRFKFMEMQPNVELLNGIEVEGVKIKDMLEVINKRIELLYDREHTIGHSFFMGLSNASAIADLVEIFECNVIPLLKEYFYNDYERIAAVLGDDLNKNDANVNFILRENDYVKIPNSEIEVPPAYKFNSTALEKPEAYKKIYE